MSRYKMRLMEPRDMDALQLEHTLQNLRDDTDYPLPRMFAPDGRLDANIALALTVEKGREVVQGIYFQSKIVEMCFAGCDPRATAFSRREIDPVRYALKSLKYEGIRCLIPQVRAEQLTRPMEATGFTRTDAKFASFFLEI